MSINANFWKRIYEAWTFAERALPTGNEGPDPDVYVRLASGELFVATFYTLERLRVLMDLARNERRCRGGEYFADESMVIVRSMDQTTIASAVEDIVLSGKLAEVFTRCRPAGAE